MNLLNFRPHSNALFCVEVGERFVHKEYGHLTYERATYCNALALTARKISGESFKIVGKSENFSRSLHLFFYYVRVDSFEHKSERKIFVNGEVGIERVGLEYHCYSPLPRSHLVCQLAVYIKLARGYVFEPCNHTQCCRFAAARIADKADKLAVFDFHIKVVNGVVSVGIDFIYVFE